MPQTQKDNDQAGKEDTRGVPEEMWPRDMERRQTCATDVCSSWEERTGKHLLKVESSQTQRGQSNVRQLSSSGVKSDLTTLKSEKPLCMRKIKQVP